MKKFILTFILALIATVSFSQPNHYSKNMVRPGIDMAQYTIEESLPIERVMVHFNKEIDNEDFISLGDNDYMAQLPHKDNMIIKYNNDKTKAIVFYNSYIFGRHFEFNIQDNERRLILYYEDKGIYCGYIYDKTWRVCKYFESRKEFNRFMRRPFFNPNKRNN